MTSLHGYDEVLLLFINQPAGRSESLDKLIIDIADSTLLKGGIFLALYWALWFRYSDKRHEDRRYLVTELVCAAFIVLISRLMQIAMPFHDRPIHTPGLGLRMAFSIDADTLNAWSSFPSDHAVLFFALCVPLWRRSSWLGVVMGAWTLIMICLPRLYLGYHYPSDVLAGAVLGIVLMLALPKVVILTTLPNRLIALEKSRPEVFYAMAFLFSFELAVLFYNLRLLGLDAVRLLKSLIA